MSIKQVSMFNYTLIWQFIFDFVRFFIGALHNLIKNSVIDEKNDTRMPKKSWKERVEATECAWKEAFQALLEYR
jgi:hypothetical protein